MRTLLLLLPSLAYAGTIDLSWAGVLVGRGGTRLDGAHDVQIRLWADETTTTALWDHTWADEEIQDGVFQTVLAGVDLAWLASDVWIGVTLDGGTEGGRTRLVHVPRAGLAERAGGVLAEPTPATLDCTDVGLTRWDTDLGTLRVCDGTTWILLGTMPAP